MMRQVNIIFSRTTSMFPFQIFVLRVNIGICFRFFLSKNMDILRKI